MLRRKQFNYNKTRFPLFNKILAIKPVEEVFGEGNERQLCSEMDVTRVTTGPIPYSTSNLVCIKEVAIRLTTFSHIINIAGIIYCACRLDIDIRCTGYKNAFNNVFNEL